MTDVLFQARVGAWMLECFGEEIASDRIERADRFVEEALELAQSIGWTRDRAYALVDYTFSRPVGEPGQEVGGVMVTLAALCNTFDLDIAAEAEREVARITTQAMIAKIRAKQAAKPTGSALPACPRQAAAPFAARYRNHRGEIALRTLVPIHVRFGASEWHPEPQWLLVGYDLDRKAIRDFALADFNPPEFEDVTTDEDGDVWSDGGKVCERSPSWWEARLPRDGETLHDAANRLYERPDYAGSLADAVAAVMDAMAKRAASTAEALR